MASAEQQTSRPQGPALIALLPPGPGKSLFDYPPVARASEEAAYFREQGPQRSLVLADATVLSDDEAGGPHGVTEVLELLSNGPKVALTIPCRSGLPLLCLHIKDLGRFLSIEIEAEDSDGNTLRIVASNKQATVRATADQLSMPLQLAPGWNVVRLDLSDIVQRGFGRTYGAATSVTVGASCRVARIYFEARPLEDAQLPAFLRTLF